MNVPKKENIPPSASTAPEKDISTSSSVPPWQKDSLAGSISSLAVDDPEGENLPVIIPLTPAPREAASSSNTTTYPRHIKLPFDLRDPTIKIEGDILQALLAIFPGTTNIAISPCRAWINFTVESLPSIQLPLTIAGLPITIGESQGSPGRGKGPMFPMSTMGNFKIRICQDLNGRDQSISSTTSYRNLGDTVIRGLFTHSPHLAVVEIIFDAERTFHIILQDDVDIPSICSKLPGNIARCWARYLNERDLHRPKGRQASREILPDPQGTVDDTPYETLRPGVLISSPVSDDHNESLVTTSGVMVQNIAGDRFMTAASHGIGHSQRLFQPQPVGDPREIGEAVVELSFTDISLVQLNHGINFDNTPFDQEGEETPRFTRLLGEATDDQIDMSLEVMLNSPFTGVVPGLVAAISFRIHPDPPFHPTENALRYNLFNWFWAGQNTVGTQPRLPDSVCGSAIWDSTGRIVGVFHFYIEQGPWAGFSAAISADEIVRAGYRLAH